MRRQIQGEVQKLTVPSLLLIPKLSEASPSFVTSSLNRLPASIKLVEIAHASHDLYLEHPKKVASQLLDFLK